MKQCRTFNELCERSAIPLKVQYFAHHYCRATLASFPPNKWQYRAMEVAKDQHHYHRTAAGIDAKMFVDISTEQLIEMQQLSSAVVEIATPFLRVILLVEIS